MSEIRLIETTTMSGITCYSVEKRGWFKWKSLLYTINKEAATNYYNNLINGNTENKRILAVANITPASSSSTDQHSDH